ncbi:cytochrome P450 [Mycobacterium sherrisii]|uniref:cytochrome P450 n=1 Tax=Mycobacterium sherrisii TaxID=243061 RepID=UPI001151C6A1|nr:cytochrome P450 [Mycobacterium sherrisii]MCV7028147.1 cytochrome P450 [Mycobacterium sherrisii]
MGYRRRYSWSKRSRVTTGLHHSRGEAMDALPGVDLTGNLAGDLHGVLREAARRGPLARDEMTGAIVALRQRDVELLVRDKRLNGIGLTLFDMMGITDGPLRDWYARLMFTTEGDYHQRMRALVSRAFTPRAVAALQDSAAQLAAAAITSAGQSGDMVPAGAAVAAGLTCRLLGVPDGDVSMFARWADALSPVFFVMTPEQIDDATRAVVELQGYVRDLIGRRRGAPGSDLITSLLDAEVEGQRLTHDETVVMISNLLVAAHDTTGSQIPCSILVALRHRDQLDGVAEDSARLSAVVAETMRMEPSVPLIPRTAVAPIDLYDTVIPAGAMVFPCIAAACRDESAWEDPDRFHPDRFIRPGTPRPLNFGAGTHYCLGTALAKLAVEECIRAVLAEVPPLYLTEDPAAIPWRQVLGRSPTRLLVGSERPALR